jgi:hypothetical protein
VKADIEKYRGKFHSYTEFATRLGQLLKQLIEQSGTKVHFVESRAKSPESFAEKIRRPGKKYKNPFDEIPDLVGGRVVLYYSDTFSEMSTSPFSSTFAHLDLFSDLHRVDSEAVERFANDYIACSKGVEITDAGNNPKSITQAFAQLKYALVDSFAESIWHQIDHLLGDESPIFSYSAFVVTTADLWRLKEGVSVADIRSAKEIQEVATKHDLLFCYEPPDNELARHSQRKLMSFFNKEQIKRMDKVAAVRNRNSFEFYAEYLSGNFPCFFAIINLDRLQATLSRSMAFFGQRNVFLEWQSRSIKP